MNLVESSVLNHGKTSKAQTYARIRDADNIFFTFSITPEKRASLCDRCKSESVQGTCSANAYKNDCARRKSSCFAGK